MENPKTCPGCGSTNIVYNEEKGQVICKDCGLISGELAQEEKKKVKKK